MTIALHDQPTLRNAFRFPVQSAAARRDLLIGGLLLLLLLPIGWLLNMGHRIVVVHRLINNEPDPWPAWHDWPALLKHGALTFAGMVVYHAPAGAVACLARWLETPWMLAPAALLWLAGTCAVPGYMTAYCVSYDASEIFNINKSVRRVISAGRGYWKAWLIALAALLLSFLGLAGLGILFFWTSVWFWQAAAFAFASTMINAQD